MSTSARKDDNMLQQFAHVIVYCGTTLALSQIIPFSLIKLLLFSLMSVLESRCSIMQLCVMLT